MSVLKSILAVGALLSSVVIATAQEPERPGIAQSGENASALSENNWDFNAPDGVPGFGPISPADVAKVLGAR